MFLLLLIPGVMYFCWDPEVDKQIIYVNQKLIKIDEKLDYFDDNEINSDSVYAIEKLINNKNKESKKKIYNNKDLEKIKKSTSYEEIKDIKFNDPNSEIVNNYYKNLVKQGKISLENYYKLIKKL